MVRRSEDRRLFLKLWSLAWVSSMILVCATAAHGQSRNTEHTLKLDSGAVPPPATMGDVAWMVGSWEGQAFGGSVEEHWMAPTAGTMTGVFKLMHDGRPSMYEFMLLLEEKDSLEIQLKHFNADFSAWEDKSEYVSFPLVKLSDDAAFFEGLTYRREGEDGMIVHVSIGEEKEEAELRFKRVGSSAPSPPATE